MLNSEQVLTVLRAGNHRFMEGNPLHPNQGLERRNEIAGGQQPLAIVVSCSDSRVPPEIVFDTGLGDLFMVRTAGHVVDDTALGSIEYAALHLHVPLIVVLGHKRCGAVKATIESKELPGHLPGLTQAIRPAVESAKNQEGNWLDNAVKENVRLTVLRLQNSEPVLIRLVRDNKLTIVGAYYDLDSGVASLIS